MASSFIIPEIAYAGLSALISIGRSKLGRLPKGLRSHPLTLDDDRLAADLAKLIDADADKMELAISNVLIPLSRLRQESRTAAPDFVRRVTDLIAEQNPEWLEANQKSWTTVSPVVGELIGPDSFFCQLGHVYQILADRPTFVEDIKVLAELRPVFDDEATTVRAYVITTTMAVRYREFGKKKNMHFTLDRQDLMRLQEQTDLAMKKLVALEQHVASLDVPALVVGAEGV